MGQISDVIACLVVAHHAQSGSGIEERFGQDAGEQEADLIDGQCRSLAVKADSETYQEVMSQGNQQHMMMPAQPTACFAVVKTDFALAFFEDNLNGTITNDKFCVTRWGKLQLSWWRRPLRLRQSPA